MAPIAHPTPFGISPVGLCGIFNDQQIVRLCQGTKRGHGRSLPIQMHGHDGFDLRRQHALHPFGVQIKRHRIRLHQNWPQPRLAHRQHCRNEGIGGHDHRIAPLEAPKLKVAFQDEFEGIQSIGDANGMRGATVSSEGCFKLFHGFPEDVPARIQHLFKGALETGPMAVVDHF